jgi:ADP-ribosylglycohydrolase
LGPAERDRAIGALVGLAAGDALGAGYEFDPHPPDDIDMIGGGNLGWEPGEWTDDTQMAICIAEVAATGDLDAAEVGERFLAWQRSGPRDVGIQTDAVLGGAKSGAGLSAVADAYFARHPARSAGNGSLMRTAAVALAHLGDDDALAIAARSVSGLTHGDPRAGEACVLWCMAIDRAVREQRLNGAWDGLALLDAEARQRWRPLLDAAVTETPASFSENGFVVTALQAALAAVLQTPVPERQPCRHLADALRAAVRIGNDTDTVAAIAGALLGARWGASAIPLAWRRLLHGWPGYHSRDLVRLAVLTAEKGRVDPDEWL